MIRLLRRFAAYLVDTWAVLEERQPW